MSDKLFSDPELAQFYDQDNRWDSDKDFCLKLAGTASSVLDLGCGTGELATVLSRTRRATGVDPAAAMLDVARGRQGSDRVQWIEADARSVRLAERFDLIVMTGHAFQCLLEPEDQASVCKTIAAHLEPEGTFVFDSRNPEFEEWRNWTPEQTRTVIDHPVLGPVERLIDAAFNPDNQIVTYLTLYTAVRSGRSWRASSQIRFSPKEDVAAAISAAGLHADRWMGDWNGNPFKPGAREIIPLGGLV
ncbi:class I SAM-dependent methyltransferase [Oricola cellulosilytica]|uniref:Class I SAM-dependent methyltransferase n=1 Tax=Oricola cellulosilytica TaxID=1429082 RepID=A0A4R0PE42_9HYPH|nr:class I SAM-dependent methyltransferase [Oricola cellulosilytica]TCD16057.1 class I SAM-dependent methyltransferase [Oricola cellulosilytica]